MKFSGGVRPTGRQSEGGDPGIHGILDRRTLPDGIFDADWEAIVLDQAVKDRLLAQAVLTFTIRPRADRSRLPLHGVILLHGPPGTGKTSLARGLASRTAEALGASVRYLEVEPHGLASASLGKSQQAVRRLMGETIAEHAAEGPLVVMLDEVETIATDRGKLSMETNPVDVHRATDALLAQLDHLAANYPQLLFLATSNFADAIDEAFLSRADLIQEIGLPTADAAAKILADAVEHLGDIVKGFDPKSIDSKSVGSACEGLDGRTIRKVVLAACAQDKATALDPSRVTTQALLDAAQRAKREREGMERSR